ncbi:hypothetical protein BDZ94DRAFT_1313501 [Collybia nuda]|uniref:Uncharacterized protein n=1 Tax=Collybia nuda TaxID=64659 RepID=A0A9P5XW77_9AGAR|nr:hypothetical protein BDZ94DRAFT_1313501 [Collybia nuda]
MVPEKTTEKGKKSVSGLNGLIYVKQVLKGPLKDFWMAIEKETGHEMLVVKDRVPVHQSVVAKVAQSKVVALASVQKLSGRHPQISKLPQQAWDSITLNDIHRMDGSSSNSFHNVPYTPPLLQILASQPYPSTPTAPPSPFPWLALLVSENPSKKAHSVVPKPGPQKLHVASLPDLTSHF